MSRGQILSLRMEQKDILAEVNQSQSERYLLLRFFCLTRSFTSKSFLLCTPAPFHYYHKKLKMVPIK